MRANFKIQRLFVPQTLRPGVDIEPDAGQVHYLATVMRVRSGNEILLFNGRDGEWLAEVVEVSRKAVLLRPTLQTRPQTPTPDLIYCFAPLKQGRLDYMVQKAVEMGVGLLQPVLTQHTQMSTIGSARLRANALEAAEQCGILSVPEVADVVKLDRVLWEWEHGRRLIVCDEGAEENNPVPALLGIQEKRYGLLVGPEGGFSDDERRQLAGLPFVTRIALGPRILRADTAAVAALAVLQATIGDWR